MRALCTIPLFAMEKTPLEELTENIQLSTTTADVSGQSAIQEKINAELKQQLNASQDVAETLKCCLANFELYFSDVLQKYDRIEKIIDDNKRNGVALMTSEEIGSMFQQVEDVLCNLETARNLLSELQNAGLKECICRRMNIHTTVFAALCDEVTTRSNV